MSAEIININEFKEKIKYEDIDETVNDHDEHDQFIKDCLEEFKRRGLRVLFLGKNSNDNKEDK